MKSVNPSRLLVSVKIENFGIYPYYGSPYRFNASSFSRTCDADLDIDADPCT